jgi:hypothetical protein
VKLVTESSTIAIWTKLLVSGVERSICTPSASGDGSQDNVTADTPVELTSHVSTVAAIKVAELRR